MSKIVKRSVALAAAAVGVSALAVTTLAAPASASPAAPTGVSRPAAPLDDVLEGPFDGSLGGWQNCDDYIWGWVKVYPQAGCIEAWRRGQYAVWLVTDSVEGT